MGKQKKKIRLSGADGIQYGRKVHWSDTWVYLNTGRGKRLSLGPTYMSAADVMSSYVMNREIDEKHFAEHPEDRTEVDDLYDVIVQKIKDREPWKYFYIHHPDNMGCPDIIINKLLLDKQTIEDATAAYLIHKKFAKPGVEFKFAWKKKGRRFGLNAFSPAEYDEDIELGPFADPV